MKKILLIGILSSLNMLVACTHKSEPSEVQLTQLVKKEFDKQNEISKKFASSNQPPIILEFVSLKKLKPCENESETMYCSIELVAKHSLGGEQKSQQQLVLIQEKGLWIIKD